LRGRKQLLIPDSYSTNHDRLQALAGIRRETFHYIVLRTCIVKREAQGQ
jgi:hypothetical protein